MRRFVVGDRIVVVAPGANDGDCYSIWEGAHGTIVRVEDDDYDGELPYYVCFDEVPMPDSSTIREYHYWCEEEELDFENEITAQIPEVDDLL